MIYYLIISLKTVTEILTYLLDCARWA